MNAAVVEELALALCHSNIQVLQLWSMVSDDTATRIIQHLPWSRAVKLVTWDFPGKGRFVDALPELVPKCDKLQSLELHLI
jgi:hypothetical protein